MGFALLYVKIDLNTVFPLDVCLYYLIRFSVFDKSLSTLQATPALRALQSPPPGPTSASYNSLEEHEDGEHERFVIHTCLLFSLSDKDEMFKYFLLKLTCNHPRLSVDGRYIESLVDVVRLVHEESPENVFMQIFASTCLVAYVFAPDCFKFLTVSSLSQKLSFNAGLTLCF
jgi:hypothetical protein